MNSIDRRVSSRRPPPGGSPNPHNPQRPGGHPMTMRWVRKSSPSPRSRRASTRPMSVPCPTSFMRPPSGTRTSNGLHPIGLDTSMEEEEGRSQSSRSSSERIGGK
jgi:hypothetical protein